MKQSNNNKVFKTLRIIRNERNISSKEMAEKLGISKAFYCQIENRTRNLSYGMAVRIADVLNLKPDKIFYDDFKLM